MPSGRFLLHSSVPSNADDHAVVPHERGADRDARLLEPLLGLEDRMPDVLKVKVGRVRRRRGLDRFFRGEHCGGTD